MPRYARYASLGLSLLVIGCSSPIAPVHDLDPGSASPLASMSSAAPETRTTMPLHFIRSNECTGEDVEITGTIHLVSRTKSDGTVVGGFWYEDTRGVGLTSGIEYRVFAFDFVRLSAPAGSSVLSVRSFRMFAPGPGNNLHVHAFTLIKVGADGVARPSIDRLIMRCR
jgi:hypothetical protein